MIHHTVPVFWQLKAVVQTVFVYQHIIGVFAVLFPTGAGGRLLPGFV